MENKLTFKRFQNTQNNVGKKLYNFFQCFSFSIIIKKKLKKMKKKQQKKGNMEKYCNGKGGR